MGPKDKCPDCDRTLDQHFHVDPAAPASVQVPELLTFSQALFEAKKGKKIQRAGWNGKGMWVAAQYPDAHSKMGEPYLYMKTVQGTLIPWTASQADLFALDWSCVDDATLG
jgi:hypothetical protein